jgi:hypothetical protein
MENEVGELYNVADSADVSTHFDLGIAYQHMGLRSDALHEYATVLVHKGTPAELLRKAANQALALLDLDEPVEDLCQMLYRA